MIKRALALCFTIFITFLIAETFAISLDQQNVPKVESGELVYVNGSVYFISDFNASATAAVRSCNRLGMKLVSIQSAAKQQAIADFLDSADYRSLYFWTSGVRYDVDFYVWSSTGQQFNYTNWREAALEPNEPSTRAHVCVLMDFSGNNREWWDVGCEAHHPYIICEESNQFN